LNAALSRRNRVLRQVHRRLLRVPSRHPAQGGLPQTAPRTSSIRIRKYVLMQEWRSAGVQQSRGWQHYELHRPEPHILLFRRAKGTDPQTGMPPIGFVPPPDIFV